MKRWLALAAGLLSGPVHADLVHLKNGSTLEGTVRRQESVFVVIDSAGRQTTVPVDDVAGIEKTTVRNAADLAASGLLSLRRAVENSEDVPGVIDRYKRFIEQYRGQAAAAEAEKDLAVWQDRLARGLVRVGDRWMTAEERKALVERTAGRLGEAVDLLKQGRLREADAVVAAVLDADPRNVGGLYLRGLILYRQDQIPAARRAFEQLREQLPEHAPTLNNLAVVLWRQNQHLAALAVYDQALAAQPRNRQIIDNVAEALNALPADRRDAPIAKRLAQRFAEQNETMSREMAAGGWFRWGAAWVRGPQLEELKQAEAEIKARRDALSEQYDQTEARIRRIDQEINENERVLVQIETDRRYVDARGRIITLALPNSYYAVEDNIRKLRLERQELILKLEQMRQQARAIQQQMPVPKFTGLQQMIGPEGMPQPQGAASAPVAQQHSTPVAEPPATLPALPELPPRPQ